MTVEPGTSPDARGLSASEVADRIAAGLTNDLPPRTGRTAAEIVKANVFTRINAILGVLLVIVLATGSWINAAFGLLIIANSAIGIIQELRAKNTLDTLAVVGEAKPRVRRDGVSVERVRTDVVLDDVIEIGPGDQIVVDGQVIAEDYLEVDESLLTGEADPQTKDPGDPLMSGSFVVSGSGFYRATKVGAESYAAQLTAEASKFSLVNSELQRGINQILKVITWLLVPVGILTIWVQLTQSGRDWRVAVLSMAGALVPMVPEGLILLTSVAFALGVIRLGRRQCLVQELPAIEGLARVDVVCADKTGTLTEGGLTLGGVESLGSVTEGEITQILAQVASSESHPNASILAITEGLGRPEVAWQAVARAPFTSARKWSGVSFAHHGHWLLGAPDVVAAPGTPAAERAAILGAEGLRILLLAEAAMSVEQPGVHLTAVPVALVILNQKVRPEAAATLRYFEEQHVAVKVISGDNAASVGAVTRSLGVHGAEPIDARTLPDGSQEFIDAVEAGQVFGRVTPYQKRQMVAALQSRGHNVAMTGDGVNDVLALKDADLGVAMGSGAPATRAVAKIVLLDDSFATLPVVVAEGRRVIGNIERVAELFLTKTVYSVILALLVGVWRIPFPYQPIHVTITGWFTIGVPAFLMSLAPNHERARPHFVARVMRFGLPAGVIVAIVTFVTHELVRAPHTASLVAHERATTATLAAMLITAIWVLAIVARPYVWWKVALVVASAGFYVVVLTLPVTQRLFLLNSGDPHLMTIGITAGVIGAACLEALWWIIGVVTKEPRRFWASDED